MGYTLEGERLHTQTAGLGDSDLHKFYKARAPLGDAEFYRAVLTLPAELTEQLDGLIGRMRRKITPDTRADLHAWRTAERTWRLATQPAAPAIGTAAWHEALRAMAALPQAGISKAEPERPKRVALPLWRLASARHGGTILEAERIHAALFWRQLRMSQGSALARDMWLLARDTNRELKRAA